MKHLIILIFFFTNSCGQVIKDENTSKSNDILEMKIDENIFNQILNHYSKDYKNEKIEKEENDSLISISFVSKDEDFFTPLLTVYIPKKKKNYISGDLNKDGLNELLVSIETQGGGQGGNVWWNDIFVFLNVNNSYILSSFKKSPDLCGCKDGYFYPEKIENGVIKGKSSCYNWDIDAHCCPSLEFETIIKFDQGKLKFQNHL